MAKIVKEERLAIVLELTGDGNVSCRADYEVSSDDLVVTRSYVPTLSVVQISPIKKFGADILNKIKSIEEA